MSTLDSTTQWPNNKRRKASNRISLQYPFEPAGHKTAYFISSPTETPGFITGICLIDEGLDIFFFHKVVTLLISTLKQIWFLARLYNMWVLNNMIWIPVRKKILKIYFFHISIFNRLSNELPLQLLKEISQKSWTKPELIMWILKKKENKIWTSVHKMTAEFWKNYIKHIRILVTFGRQ